MQAIWQLVSVPWYETAVSRFRARTISSSVNLIGQNVFIEWVYEVHFARFESVSFNYSTGDEEQNNSGLCK